MNSYTAETHVFFTRPMIEKLFPLTERLVQIVIQNPSDLQPM